MNCFCVKASRPPWSSSDAVGQGVFVQNQHGHWQDIFSLRHLLAGPYFRALELGRFRGIILDAMCRFMPRQMDENDNGTIANDELIQLSREVVKHMMRQQAEGRGAMKIELRKLFEIKPYPGQPPDQRRHRGNRRGGLHPRVRLPPADRGQWRRRDHLAGTPATRERSSSASRKCPPTSPRT
jgi:hypothetical protein